MNSKYGFIDRAGKIVIAPEYDFADEFSEGLACVQAGGNWFYIDASGYSVIKFVRKVKFAHSFSEGLAYVDVGGKTGYIDKTGRWIIKPQFDIAFSF